MYPSSSFGTLIALEHSPRPATEKTLLQVTKHHLRRCIKTGKVKNITLEGADVSLINLYVIYIPMMCALEMKRDIGNIDILSFSDGISKYFVL